MASDRLRLAHLDMLRGNAEPHRGGGAFPPAGLEYLQALIRSLASQGRKDIPAEELCRAFGRSAARDFGPFLAETLERFGMRTGAELGQAVFLLAARGCVNLREGESREEYAACGSLGDGA